MDSGYLLGVEDGEYAVGGAGKGGINDDLKIFDLRQRHLWVPFTSVGKAGEGVGSKIVALVNQ